MKRLQAIYIYVYIGKYHLGAHMYAPLAPEKYTKMKKKRRRKSTARMQGIPVQLLCSACKMCVRMFDTNVILLLLLPGVVKQPNMDNVHLINFRTLWCGMRTTIYTHTHAQYPCRHSSTMHMMQVGWLIIISYTYIHTYICCMCAVYVCACRIILLKMRE